MELVVEPTDGWIRGTVQDETGGPIDDAFVTAFRESEAAGAQRKTTMRFDAGDRPVVLSESDGSFRIDALSPGEYTVQAYRKGGGQAIAEHVDVDREVELAIPATGSIAGRVSLADGGRPERFAVELRETKTGARQETHPFRTDGEWIFSRVPAGNYVVEAQAPEGTGSQRVELAAGAERSGVELVLDDRVTLRGRFVRVDSNEPIPGLWAQVNAASKRGINFVAGRTTENAKEISDANGVFEIVHAQTGDIRLVILPESMDTSEYDITMIRRQIASAPAEQDLGDIPIAHQRVKPPERGGDPGFTLAAPGPGESDERRVLRVANIRAHGPADGLDLQVGDVIVSVDGYDVSGERTYLFAPLVGAPAGTRVRLGLQRGVEIVVRLGEPV